ncbi:phosphoribosyl transferase [Arthrobacter phage Atuin]|nr:phosphoribosyl transferase [Arthrobacter phage Atuin]
MITFKAKTESGEIIKSAISDFIFPAGEAHIKVEPKRSIEKTEIAIIQPSADSLHDDLFKLAMWNDYLYTKPNTDAVLILPYFPGARADRISPGVEEPFGLGVYAEFISNLTLKQVIIFDPHSSATETVLQGEFPELTVVESHELFSQPWIEMQIRANYSGIIAPDKGAVERASAVADVLGLPVYTAEKKRDPETGKLTGFSVDLPDKNEAGFTNYFLIVDDICDRGGTFLGLVEASGLEFGRIDLFVSHGVFSSDAIKILPEKFEQIWTTNSYNPNRELNDPDIEDWANVFTRFDVIHLLLEKVI